MTFAIFASERMFSGNARMRERSSCCMAVAWYELTLAPQRRSPRKTRSAYSGVIYNLGAGDLAMMLQISLRVMILPSRWLATTIDLYTSSRSFNSISLIVRILKYAFPHGKVTTFSRCIIEEQKNFSGKTSVVVIPHFGVALPHQISCCLPPSLGKFSNIWTTK